MRFRAGPDQHRPAAELQRRFEVADRVAHTPAARRIQIEGRDGFAVEGRARLAARAAGVRCVRAVVRRVHGGAGGPELVLNLALRRFERGERVPAATNSGLIGDNDPDVTGLFHRDQCRGRAGEQPDLAGIGEIPAILDQRAIAIEKHGRPRRDLAGHYGLMTFEVSALAFLPESALTESALSFAIESARILAKSLSNGMPDDGPGLPPGAITPATEMK